MTAVNPNYVSNGGDIPDGIDTLEKLLIWAGSKYNQIYGSATYSEVIPSAVDNGQRVIAGADTAGTPAGPRAIVRASVPLPANYMDSSNPVYSIVLEQSQAVLP